MTAEIQSIIKAVQNEFWHPKTIEEHLKTTPVYAVKNIDNLKSDFWPENESADDFIKYIYGQRRSQFYEAGEK